MGDEIARLGDALYRKQVLRTRQRSPEPKLLARAQLFQHAHEILRAGIRAGNPEADEQEIRRVRNVIAVQAGNIDGDQVHRWCDVPETRQALDAVRSTLPPDL